MVHAINPVAIGGNLPPEEVAEFSEKDDLGKCEWSLKRVLTPYAEIGHHLQFENIQYKSALIDRPHIHWSANQLVQPNSGGNWEASKIAILEPLSSIEKSADMRVFGVAPYDILTIGSHRLSANAVIIVPKGVEHIVRLYLTGFQGRIVSYNENDVSLTLRKIISENLAAIYPDVWNIVTETGKRIDIVESLTSAGYAGANVS